MTTDFTGLATETEYVSRIDKLLDDIWVDHEEEIRMYRDMIWDRLCEAQNKEDRQYANCYLNHRGAE